MNKLKLVLFAACLMLGSAAAHAQAAGCIVRNLGSDAYATTATQPVSCTLYLSGVKVVNTLPVAKAAFFPNITLCAGQSYSATCTDAIGFESAQSVPFVLPAAIIAPTGLRAVP